MLSICYSVFKTWGRNNKYYFHMNSSRGWTEHICNQLRQTMSTVLLVPPDKLTDWKKSGLLPKMNLL